MAGGQGRFLGLRYDWRRLDRTRLREAVWRPDDQRLFVPKAWGGDSARTCIVCTRGSGFRIGFWRVQGRDRVPRRCRGTWCRPETTERRVAAPDSLAGYATIGAAEGIMHGTDIAAGLGLPWTSSSTVAAPVHDTVFSDTGRAGEPPLTALPRVSPRV
jgi:hypothetical protein